MIYDDNDVKAIIESESLLGDIFVYHFNDNIVYNQNHTSIMTASRMGQIIRAKSARCLFRFKTARALQNSTEIRPSSLIEISGRVPNQ
jgi:hypothetical protein